jgi:hypothetical protein
VITRRTFHRRLSVVIEELHAQSRFLRDEAVLRERAFLAQMLTDRAKAYRADATHIERRGDQAVSYEAVRTSPLVPVAVVERLTQRRTIAHELLDIARDAGLETA